MAMTCLGCGHANPERAKFCLECGTAFAARCPSCGTELPAAAKFCLECGTPVPGTKGLATASSPPPNPSQPSAARKVVTILFADLAGSTALQERLDPESTRGFMERYYRAMSSAVEAHGGTVVKLLGDGVMAAFGVPTVAEDDAIRAVRAAMEMVEVLGLGVEGLGVRGSESAPTPDPLSVRIAVNTGEVVVSSDDSDVVGDPVNVAARLQQEAGTGEVVIGESTQRLVASLVTLAPLGSFALKGRSETVKAYRVVSLERPATAIATAFVGRDDELTRLTTVYEAAIAAPAARLAVLLGSPGLGKSRLIDELRRRLGTAATVVAAQCDAAGGGTFAPIAAALRQHLAIDAAAGPDALRTAIEALLPSAEAERARIAGGVAALLTGSPTSPEETFFVIRRLLAGIAAARPLLLVIDDLHWAEPLLLDLVEHLIQWGSGVPLLVLVGTRPELRATRASLTVRGPLVADVVTLGGLDAGAATRLAANVIGAADLPAAVAGKLLATSEGNPLFVAELVRMLVQEGALTRDGDRWIVGDNLAALEMPPTIHALLAARIERLPPDERGLLERAAVVGRHFSRNAVAALLPDAAGGLDARLESLKRSELIESDSGWFLGEPVLRFHHVLIRDAAYRRLLKGTRAELHARLADWIEARAGDAVEHDETIGRHLEQAHQHLNELGLLDAHGRRLGQRASQRLAAAGRRALAGDDLPLAASLLGRALAGLDSNDAARADLALDWCEALLAAGEVGPAAAAIEELARFAVAGVGGWGLGVRGEEDGVGGSGLGGGGGEERSKDVASDASLCAAAPSGARPADPFLSAPNPQPLTPNPLFSRSQPPTPNPLSSDPQPLSPNPRLSAWHTCFTGQLTVLTAPQGLQTTADAVAAAAAQFVALGDAAGEAKAHHVHAQALARLGRVGACEAALDKALAAARRAGDRRRANAVLAGAPLAALWGPSPVTRASGRCLDVVRVLRITQGAPAVEAVALSCQGVLEALRGRTDAARRMIASSRKMVEELGITHRLFEADAFVGRIELLEGDAVAAARSLRGAYEGLRDLGLGIDAAQAAALLARALLAQGRAAEAEALSRDSEALAGDDLQAAIAWRGVRAEALAQRGEHATAVELARAAVTIATATDALLDHADARLALAAALRAAGRAGEADAEQRHAVELWEAKGATLLAERVRRDADRVAPVGSQAPDAPAIPPLRPRRRPRRNTATVYSSRVLAAIEARDLDAIAAICADDLQIVHHPSGLSYGYGEGLERFRLLFQATHLSVAYDSLATLGDALVLFRDFTSFSGLNDGELSFGAARSSYVNLLEINDRQQLARIEIFAESQLSPAIARLYARYAELLPHGAARERAEQATGAVATINATTDPDRLAPALIPSFECVDHRPAATWRARDAQEFLEHWHRQNAVAANVSLRDDDVLALGPDTFLVRRIYSGLDRASGEGFETLILILIVVAADGRLARAEIWEADREAAALARFDALTGAAAAPPVRRVRPNAATAVLARMEAAFAAHDLDAVDALLSEAMESVDHQTGSAYGREAHLDSSRRMMRVPGLAFRLEVLATLGDRLCLMRRLVTASGTAGGNFDVAAYEMEHVGLLELDATGRCRSFETFATDHLGPAVVRLYARYAELLPEGTQRQRATVTARAIAYSLTDSTTPDETLLFDPLYEDIDHRTVGYGTLSTAEAQKLVSSQRALADDLRFRLEDILALRRDGLVRKSTTSGIWRDGGGAFERTVCMLSLFGADGRATRQETFEGDREAEALARFDELTGALAPQTVRRRVRANAATANGTRITAAIVASDHVAAERELGESFQAVHHPTGLTYDRAGLIETVRNFARSKGASVRRDVLATLGDTLGLARQSMSIDSAENDAWSSGAAELETLMLEEVDHTGRRHRGEIFAADHLGDAVARLYACYAALLPDGAAQQRASVTAGAIAAMVAPPDLDHYAAALAPSVEFKDHRTVGFASGRGATMLLRGFRSLLELATDVATRVDDVVALEPGAMLLRWTTFGTDRRSGGTFESSFLLLWIFGADGLIVRDETFDAGRETEALARFDELTRAPPPLARRVRENAATATIARFDEAVAARDADALAALLADGVEFVHHPTVASYGRRGILTTWRSLFRAKRLAWRKEVLATLGDSLALTRQVISVEGLAEDDLSAVGCLELEEVGLWDVDAHGRSQRMEVFAPDHAGDAIARLYERYAELLPDGPARSAAAVTAHAFAVMQLPVDLARMATVLAASVECVDHRHSGTWSLQGVEQALEHFRLQEELTTGFSTRDEDVLALESHAVLLRRTYCGTLRATAGAFENRLIMLMRFGADGLYASAEIWEPERAAEALARFDELAECRTPASPNRLFANAATSFRKRMNAAWHARDWVGLAELLAHDYRFSDRRRLVQIELDRNGWVEMARQLGAMDSAEITTEELATRGNRLALWRVCIDVADGDVGPSHVEHLNVHEVNAAGDRLIAGVRFDADDLDAAYAELDARYEAGEGAAHAAHAVIMRAFAAAVASRDWDPVVALCTPTFVEHDHRALAVLGTTHGGAAWAQNFRTLTDLAPDTAYRVDHFRSAARGFWTVGTWHGTRDGGRYEIARIAVIELDTGGRLVRADIYDEAQSDQALVRFAALAADTAAPQRFANAATATVDPVVASMAAHDWQGFARLFADDFRMSDRRRLVQLELDRDQYVAFTREVADRRAMRNRWELVATRGERLAIIRTLYEFADADVGPSEIAFLLLMEVDARGRIVANVRWDVDDLDAAYAEIDARWAAGAAATHPAAALWLADYLRYFAAREWTAMTALFAPDLVGENHRLVGWGTRHGPAGVVSTLQAQIDLASDTRERVDHIRTCRNAVLFEYAWCGTREGGAFENVWLVVVELNADGVACRADVWEVEQHEQAQARFAQIAEKADYASRAERGRTPPNAATRVRDQVDDAFRSQDWDAMRALAADELVFEDRRRWSMTCGGVDMWVGSSSAIHTASAVGFRDEVIATFGERIELRRRLVAGIGPAGGDFESEFIVLTQVDADARLIASINFDLDARAAAFAEAEQRAGTAKHADLADAATRPLDRAGIATVGPDGVSSRANAEHLAAIADGIAAIAALERYWALFDVGPEVDWEALRASCSPELIFEDRQGFARLAGDRELMIASLRERAASGARAERRLIGTAGERVVIMRMLWSGGPSDGRFEIEYLSVVEVDATGLVAAIILFAADDTRGAQRDAWARWAAVDPTVAEPTSVYGAVLDAANDRDAARYHALFADALVIEDHRYGIRIEGLDAYAEQVALLWQHAPDSRIDGGWFWPAVARHGAVTVTRRLGALADEFLWLFSIEHGRIARIEVFGLDAVDAAVARLAELRADPLRVPANAAARAIDDLRALRPASASPDTAELRARMTADFCFDDRGRRSLVRGGFDEWLASLRFLLVEARAQIEADLVATAGDRLALHRVRWHAGSGGARVEMERWRITEVDETSRLRAMILFDSDQRTEASKELFERYAASGADGATQLALDVVRAWNAHHLERLRALLPTDFYLDDRRRTGVGRLDDAEAYLTSLAAMWELSRDLRTDVLYTDMIAPHGRVYVARWSGTNTEGGEFDAVYVCLALTRGDRPIGMEIYELADLDTARERFAALRPDPLRIQPNAATQASDRQRALVEAKDWDAVQALQAPSFVFDDRRRGLHTTTDRDGYLKGLRWSAGTQTARTLLATAGDRLALWHNRFTRTREVLLFEVETLAVHEIDAEGRLAAVDLFDPDDLASAHAALFERYVANDGDGMPRGMVEYSRALNAHDLARARTGLCDDFILDDHRRTGMGRQVGAEAHLAAVKVAYELTRDLSVHALYAAAVAPHGRVVLVRASGTLVDGGAFESLCVVLVGYRDERIAAFELFEPDSLDAALARFAALAPAAAR